MLQLPAATTTTTEERERRTMAVSVTDFILIVKEMIRMYCNVMNECVGIYLFFMLSRQHKKTL